MTPTKYLQNEFRRYFPDAIDVEVCFEDDETITIDVLSTYGDRTVSVGSFIMEIGSDDDRFVFIRRDVFRPGAIAQHADPTDVITVPLMPETDA